MLKNKFILELNNCINRPFLYHVNSIDDIHCFVRGYLTALSNVDCKCTENSKEIFELMDSFNEYILEKYKCKDTNWAKLIRFRSADDRNSIELFGKLFSTFLETNKITV